MDQDKRKELNNLQKDVVALIADISDAETRLEKLRASATELYENTDAKLDNERQSDEHR